MKHAPPNCDDPAAELREHEMHRTILAGCLLSLWVVSAAGAQDLDSSDVHVGLAKALPVALARARADFPDLNQYLLYSVHPRVLLGDPKGLFWQFTWQQLGFPHRNQLVVRVYMRDGTAGSERVEQMATPSLPEQ
jgi:hypothetical protein